MHSALAGPCSTLLHDDPLLIQSWAPGLTSVARPSYVGSSRPDTHREEECDQPSWPAWDVSQVSHVWTLVMRPGLRVNHSQIAICRGFVCRAEVSPPALHLVLAIISPLFMVLILVIT